MNIPAPDIYFGKKIRVYSPDGDITEGNFFGFSYDYDDDDNEVLDFDVMRDDGFLIGFTEEEIERIEIIGEENG